MQKCSTRTLELTILGIAACVGCAGDPMDQETTAVGGVAAGGYIGLGKYTGISGTYGNGTPALTGGAPNLGLGGASQGGVSNTGGVATGGAATATGGSNGTGATASTTGGATSGGATSTAQGGATGGRAMAGSTSGGATTGGTVSRGGAATGGVAVGGASKGGAAAGGVATGGGVGVGGATTGGGFAWPGTYNPSGTASDPTGKHNAGTNCMSSACHASTQASRAFAFGGTVYQPGGTTPAANVQIAITSGATTVTTYSATNGNFWLPLASAASINWTGATVHLRNAKGEVAKPAGTSASAACNSCHGSTLRIVGP